nr:DMT family transporter [Allostreptomyces psammosilenae]
MPGTVLAATATLIVGLSFVANSLLAHYPYLGGQAVRYAVAAVLLSLLVRRAGPGRVPRVRLGARRWLRLALLAATGMVGFNVAILAAERTAEPAVPGVVVGCAPLVIAVVAPLLERRRPSPRLVGAAALVVAGAAVVQGFGRTDAAGFGYSLLALAGEVAFALVAVPLLPPLGPLRLSALACWLAAAEAAVLGVLVDGAAVLRLPTGVETAALAWQAVVVTVVGFVFWYAGVQRIGAERAGLFSGLIPVSAVLAAPLVGTGTLGPAQVVGGVLVALGVCAGASAPRPGGPRRGGGTGRGGAGGRAAGQLR